MTSPEDPEPEDAGPADDAFRASFDYAPTGMLLLTLDGVFIRANHAFGEMVRHPPAEIAGRSLTEFIFAEEVAESAYFLDQLVRGVVRRMRFERRFRRSDGLAAWAEVICAVAPGRHGAPDYLVVHILDLPGRDEVDRALADSEERFRVAFEQAPVGMLLLRPEGEVVRANAALCKMIGVSEPELVGTSYQGPADATLAGSLELLRLANTGEAVRFERTYVRPDGDVVHAHVTTSLIRSPDGAPLHLLAHYEDVTAQRRAAEDLARSEEQLRRTQRLEAVGRLAGGIAHDFNNMLSVILNYADFVRQRVARDERTLEYVDAIRKAALRSAALTRQLMIFARRDVVSPEVLDLNDLVGDVTALLTRTLGEDVAIVTDLAQGLQRVTLARSRAEQVLMNLTVNARDAMPDGGRLTIGTRNLHLDAEAANGLRPGPYVEMTVADDGIGMSPELLALAFEPFFTTKDPALGTGLGLSIVYGIVQDAGGRVEVETAPGEGAKFRVLLPATLAAVEAPATDASEVPLGRGETILVVEDEPELRALTMRILAEAGYLVRTVLTAPEAVRVCEEHGPPDLVLTDVVMPALSGPEVAARLRELHPSLPVLFMSGHADDRLTRHRRSLRGALLEKPFQGPALLRAVRRALDEQS